MHEHPPDLRATAYGGDRHEQPGPYPVGRVNLRLRDDARPTPENGRFRGLPYRQLNTSVWYPAQRGLRRGSRPLAAGGPFPLILYSHGFCSSRSEATRMAAHLASHGYILIAADFPLSSTLARGGRPTLMDVRGQAEDVGFLLREMSRRNDHPRSRFHRAVDLDRVGAAGISLGATTTLLATYHAKLHEPRIRAAVSIAGPTSMFGPDFFGREVPLLHVHGDRDALVYYAHNARPLLERTGPWAHLLTVEGGSHSGFAHIPMERLSLQLFGALVGPAGAHPDHADRLGCGVILRMLPDEMDFGSTLGPLEHGLQLPDPTRPGATSILGQPAAPPDHQRRIAISSTLAFFQSHFARRPGDREAARRFVWETMPSRAGVQLESGRRAAPEADAS